MPRPASAASVLLLVAAFAGVGLGTACSSRGRARDVAGDRRPRRDAGAGAGEAAAPGIPTPPPDATTRTGTGRKGTLFVRASTRALALDATNLYYGDSGDDGIYAIAKTGGEPARLARHAPVAGAIALDGDTVTWIASPGDAVLRVSLRAGGQPTTLRDRGIFSGVAAATAEVFITEATGVGGALLRVTGATAVRLAGFEGSARAVMADATHAYVVTPTKIFRTPHVKGEFETIATGTSFGCPQMDETSIYIVTEQGGARVIARMAKTGGPLTVVVRDVADAPIAIEGSDLFFFDATRPQVLAVALTGKGVRVVLHDDALASPTAIVADATTIYVGSGDRESGVILTGPRR